MKKSTPTPPRPGTTRGTANPTGRGSRKGTKVRQITKVTRPFKKSVVRNPSAPKGVGSGATPGLVKVITKSESLLKREKAGRTRSGIAASNKIPDKGRVMVGGYPLRSDREKLGTFNRREQQLQTVAGTSARYGASFNELRERDKAMRSAAGKSGTKPSQKITPKKKPEAPKKTAPKRKLFVGRGGGMRGGSGGGGFGAFNDANR